MTAVRRRLRAERRDPGAVVPDRRRRRIRVHADAQAARAVSRSPARAERPRQRAAAATGRAAVQQSRRREHALPHRHHAGPRGCAPASRSIRLVAKASGQDTALPSLELALESVDSGATCDFGRSCVYTGTISWAGPESPLPMEHDPERRVRAPVRRQRHHRCRRAARPHARAESSILDSLVERGREPARPRRPGRSLEDLGLSRQRSRRRAAHRSAPLRTTPKCRSSIGPAGSPGDVRASTRS